MTIGKVFLIGAGPGDPELLTLKGMRRLSEADVVVYDFLANPRLLQHARADAERIYVGKKGSDHTLPQDEINKLIINLALEGKSVARLKGGDPYVFGRGGEEAEELIEAGVPFEEVPGISSAIAAPAYAGIPVTHRRYTSNVGFITGHEDPTKAESALDWNKIATSFGTLVFLMGVKNIANIAANLMAAGRDKSTPAAAIRWGTTPDQEVVTGCLVDIADKIKAAGLKPPAVLVVGGVVEMRDKLNWFEALPLFGRRILVTRSREQASRLVRSLAELGADVIECPTIRTLPPESWDGVDDALSKLSNFDWLILTSPNGADFFFQRLFNLDLDARALAGLKIAAIGPATAEKLKAHGLRPDLVPREYVAEGLIEALSGENLRGARILIARAEQARDVLPDALRRAGAAVRVETLYRTVPPEKLTEAAESALADGKIDLVTFTSSSTAANLADLLGNRLDAFRQSVPAASIGPITTQTARDLGFDVAAEAREYTIDGLIEAVTAYFEARPKSKQA